MIYTTYFSNIRNLEPGIVPISIARTVPKGYAGLEYKKLAPSWDLLSFYKRTNDWESYVRCYTATLREHNVHDTIHELCKLAGSGNIALVCWEGKGKPCHRHLVADWFVENGYPCMEW